MLQRNFLLGVVVGGAALAAGAVFLPGLMRVARPAAKATMKAGLAAYQRGSETFAELGEAAEDLYAEVQSELADEAAATEAAAAAAAGSAAAAAKPKARRRTGTSRSSRGKRA